jgi:hypothetical protein
VARRPRRAIENLVAIVVMFCDSVVFGLRAEMEFWISPLEPIRKLGDVVGGDYVQKVHEFQQQQQQQQSCSHIMLYELIATVSSSAFSRPPNPILMDTRCGRAASQK